MECPKIIEWQMFIDEECTAQGREAYTQHLEQCGACRMLVEEMRVFDGLIAASIRSTGIPADLENSINMRIDTARKMRARVQIAGMILLFMLLMATGINTWWPWLDRVHTLLRTFLGGDIALQAAVILSHLMVGAARLMLRGGAVMPELIMLSLGLIVLRWHLGKGGLENV